MSMADRIDGLVTTILAAVVGMVLLCSFALPLIATEIQKIANSEVTEIAGYADLFWMIPLFLVIGILLFLIRRFNREGSE